MNADLKNSGRILSGKQLEQFHADGYVVVPNAFSEKTAASCAAAVLEALGQEQQVDPNNPESARYVLGRRAGPAFADLVTPTVTSALDDLLGEGTWDPSHFASHGAFFVTFPGFHGTNWRPPLGVGRWHVDHGYERRAFYELSDGNCAVVPVFLLTRTESGGAATVVVRGSHRLIARLFGSVGKPLARYPVVGFCEALMSHEVEAAKVVELTGNAGDFAILHPLLIHCASPNVGSRIRIMCNTGVGLRGKRRISESGVLSPVDANIREALTDIDTHWVSRYLFRAGVHTNHALWKMRYRAHGGLPALIDAPQPLVRALCEGALRKAGAHLAGFMGRQLGWQSSTNTPRAVFNPRSSQLE